VAREQRATIEEAEGGVGVEDDVSLLLTGDDRAEDAVRVGGHP
jgi:hypothetical protein